LSKRSTLTRDDWLAGAMELLRERGIGGVRILTLGFPPAEATARGYLLAVSLMSEEAILIGESLKTRLRLLRRQVRSLTQSSR
jgi:hypothetical protein